MIVCGIRELSTETDFNPKKADEGKGVGYEHVGTD